MLLHFLDQLFWDSKSQSTTGNIELLSPDKFKIVENVFFNHENIVCQQK